MIDPLRAVDARDLPELQVSGLVDNDGPIVRRPRRRLPPVEIVGIDVVPMTASQYEAAVQALAVLIGEWYATR